MGIISKDDKKSPASTVDHNKTPVLLFTLLFYTFRSDHLAWPSGEFPQGQIRFVTAFGP